VAIVTGGGSGIGEEVTKGLVEHGVRTKIFSRSRGEDTARRLGDNCEFFQTDVTDAESVKDSIERTVEEHGRIDYLINNAGYTSDNLLVRMSPEEWSKVIDVNLNGVFNCTKAALRYMIKGTVAVSSIFPRSRGSLATPVRRIMLPPRPGSLGLQITCSGVRFPKPEGERRSSWFCRYCFDRGHPGG